MLLGSIGFHEPDLATAFSKSWRLEKHDLRTIWRYGARPAFIAELSRRGS